VSSILDYLEKLILMVILCKRSMYLCEVEVLFVAISFSLFGYAVDGSRFDAYVNLLYVPVFG